MIPRALRTLYPVRPAQDAERSQAAVQRVIHRGRSERRWVERPDEWADLIHVRFPGDVVLILTSAQALMLAIALNMEAEIIQRTMAGEYVP